MGLKFSIVTPSLNQGKFIRDTIESVLKQQYDNFEHIIVDGGSTDETLDIIKEYTHINLITGRDTGPSNAINIGFKYASGCIGAWINSDDYYQPNIFVNIDKIFRENKDIGLVFGRLTIVDGAKKLMIKEKETSYDLQNLIKVSSDDIRQPCTFFRQSVYKDLNGLNEKLKLVFDYDLFLRMMEVSKSYYIDKNLAYYRDHGQNLTRRFVRRQAIEIFKVSRIHGAKLSDKIVKRIVRKLLTGKP